MCPTSIGEIEGCPQVSRSRQNDSNHSLLSLAERTGYIIHRTRHKMKMQGHSSKLKMGIKPSAASRVTAPGTPVKPGLLTKETSYVTPYKLGGVYGCSSHF